ncbi:type 2 periplasmic-binding domain-containing protein [Paenibacillus cymbidii]|uniref:extracellular solute-binding protein n=1 Tax=Paenibacillus cymbidii TaxID=1639034 RepID=UPI00107FE9E4|nr:extracellular solute-binding protein [Paenibacillus cymbidii]
MKRKSSAVTVWLLFLILSLSLAACSSKQGSGNASPSPTATGSAAPTASAAPKGYPENGLPNDQKVTLKVGFFEGGMGRAYIDYAIDTFKKKFPNVSFDVTYSPEMAKLITTKISAGNDDDMFDIFSTNSVDIISLSKAGKVEPQEDVWNHKAFDSDKTLKELSLEGQFASAPRVSGKTYALPIVASGSGLFFDKNLFQQNGWNQNPKTWNEFVQLGEAIKAKGIIPITYPGKYPGYISSGFGDYKLFELAEQSGNLAKFEDNYRNFKLPEYLSPERIELWKRIADLAKKGFFPQGVAALTHTQSQMQVIQHQAAMVSTGVWVQNEMKDSTPADFKWGFMAVPMGNSPDQTIWVQNNLSEGFYIWAAKPDLNKKWAKEFSAWLWNLDVQQRVADQGGQLPVRKDYMEDSARASKLQDAPKALLEYTKTNKVHMESQYRLVTLTDPSFAQAKKVITDATTEITSGKQDPLPKLEEAEALMKKAVEAQAK